jgi:arylformamidase
MIIYKNYDQAALNRQYNNRLQSPDFAVHLDNWEQWSHKAEKDHSFIFDIQYGKADRERLDILPSFTKGSKVLIFIHGGYWHKMDKSSFRFVAPAFHEYNVTTVLINYPLAPAYSMDQIVTSVRHALQWVYTNIGEYNGDSNQLYIAGHSAGGHLATMLLTNSLQQHPALPRAAIRAIITLSALFNLVPIQLSEINAMTAMDNDTAMKNSPVNKEPVIKVPMLIAVGQDETHEFKDQSEEFVNAWKSKLSIRLLELPALNHYSILSAFTDKRTAFHKAVCDTMEIQ